MEVEKVKSQSEVRAINSASGHIFDHRYVGIRQEELPIDMPDPLGTSGERKARYIRVHTEKVRPKQEKAKQVGWWLGRVEDVYADYFAASLVDKQGRLSVAEFSKEEIDPSDLNLLVPDARFSYTVTRMDRRSGREYVSKISLSGKAIWTKKDSEKAEEAYERLFPEEVFE